MAESILEIMKKNAQVVSDRLCIVDSQGAYTYAKIWSAIKYAAIQMKELGVNSKDCVLVECTQDARYIICDFACNLVGAIFVPLEKHASWGRVQEIYQETDAVLLICEENHDNIVKSVSFLNIVKGEYENDIEYIMPKEQDTAEILYTTGTTGKSKGIEISYMNDIALAENIAYGTEMKDGNVEWIPLPLSHSHAIRCCYANFYRRGTVVLTDGVTGVAKIYELIGKYHVTALDLSPTAATVLLKLTRGRFSEFNNQLDYIQIGTAALSEELKMELCKQFPDVRLYNFYGSTESGRSCVLNFNSLDNRKYCIGRPTINATFIVTDEEKNEIRSDSAHCGLLASAGAMNMKGYWRHPELTAQIMQNGYVYTNDEGYIDENGYVYILGRKDDIINYKGIKIAPEEIEEIVKKNENIEDCACVPVPDEIAGQVPRLFLVLRKADQFNKKEFISFLERNIDENKMPKQIDIIDKIPRSSNGKIQRNKLLTK